WWYPLIAHQPSADTSILDYTVLNDNDALRVIGVLNDNQFTHANRVRERRMRGAWDGVACLRSAFMPSPISVSSSTSKI
ncbi:hypothetical protein ACMYL3_24970, partial [Salmonella enterica subsp. enterica serovar Typhimurium]|uniref:hypothetical protein n=1 Tax=Salmonella enterica TaxID=28901 RepID=UPI0039E7C435